MGLSIFEEYKLILPIAYGELNITIEIEKDYQDNILNIIDVWETETEKSIEDRSLIRQFLEYAWDRWPTSEIYIKASEHMYERELDW